LGEEQKMATTLKLRSLLLVGLLALAGCDDGPSVVAGMPQGGIVKSTLTYIHARGAVLTEVYGDPFNATGGDVAGKVIAAVQGSIQSPLLKFTGKPAEAGIGNATFRIAFGYPTGTQTYHLCDQDVPELEARDDEKITVLGVFCLDGELLADAEGWVKNIDGIDDFRFRQLISQLAITVLDNEENN
jgi:hypothetical protein